MGQRVAKARGDGALVVTPLGHGDLCAFAADRPLAVGASHETHGHRRAFAQCEPDLARIKRDMPDACRDDRGQHLLRARVKPLDQRGVGDVVAEGFEPELARLELDVRRPEQAPRGVDDADGLERRGLQARADRHNIGPHMSQCKRCDQP